MLLIRYLSLFREYHNVLPLISRLVASVTANIDLSLSSLITMNGSLELSAYLIGFDTRYRESISFTFINLWFLKAWHNRFTSRVISMLLDIFKIIQDVVRITFLHYFREEIRPFDKFSNLFLFFFINHLYLQWSVLIIFWLTLLSCEKALTPNHLHLFSLTQCFSILSAFHRFHSHLALTRTKLLHIIAIHSAEQTLARHTCEFIPHRSCGVSIYVSWLLIADAQGFLARSLCINCHFTWRHVKPQSCTSGTLALYTQSSLL